MIFEGHYILGEACHLCYSAAPSRLSSSVTCRGDQGVYTLRKKQKMDRTDDGKISRQFDVGQGGI